MNGYIWLVKAYREALRRSVKKALCWSDNCTLCNHIAKSDVRLSFKESVVNKLKWK